MKQKSLVMYDEFQDVKYCMPPGSYYSPLVRNAGQESNLKPGSPQFH